MTPDPIVVGETIKQYEKHGWRLRRALVSPGSVQTVRGALGDVPMMPSDFDALWFSRKSNPATEAWELRRLTGSPFALIAVVSADADDGEVDATLAQVAEEMRAKTIA